jgi:YrhK-like protein
MLGHRLSERYPRTPEGWTVVDRHTVGPFTNRVTYRRPEGELVEWSSRFHRKHASRLSRLGRRRGRWLAPRHASWWIGVLFAIGSACFFVGPFPGFVQLVGSAADGTVFFVGSLFFTSAALLQYLEAANADRDVAGSHSKGFRVITFEPHRIDWWSTLIQFVGTLFFNVNTYRAMQASFDTSDVNRLVWAPEAVGSICFLISGLLAYLEVRDGGLLSARHTLEWKIATVNFLGCILFGISAVAGYIVPDTGDPLDLAAANVTTSLGGLCFLIGALLLISESAKPAVTAEAEP